MVIGGCGFLGRHLVEGLITKGYDVRVFDMKQSFEDKRLQFFVGDLCNKEVRSFLLEKLVLHNNLQCTHREYTCLSL